jgi:hypothetical protein
VLPAIVIGSFLCRQLLLEMRGVCKNHLYTSDLHMGMRHYAKHINCLESNGGCSGVVFLLGNESGVGSKQWMWLGPTMLCFRGEDYEATLDSPDVVDLFYQFGVCHAIAALRLGDYEATLDSPRSASSQIPMLPEPHLAFRRHWDRDLLLR